MNNTPNIYDPNTEWENTLKTMINNFSHWYDWDPTEEQTVNFETNRKETIKDKYEKSLELRELENRTRELISTNPEIQNTIKDIIEYHKWQYRKIDQIPYTEHPIAVAKIISRNFSDKEIIEAWLLHDVIEDVQNWRSIMQKYPNEIYELVDSVTEQDKSLSRKERKDSYISHIETYNYKSLAISLSDRIQNLRDMITSLEKYWNDIWNKFNAWPEEQKRFILSYSIKVKEQIDKIEDEKNYNKLMNLYNELSILIWYFLELLEKN